MKVENLSIYTIDETIIIETGMLVATGFARWFALKREGITDYSFVHVYRKDNYED